MGDVEIARYRVANVGVVVKGDTTEQLVTLHPIAGDLPELVVGAAGTADVVEGDEFALVRVRRAEEGDR